MKRSTAVALIGMGAVGIASLPSLRRRPQLFGAARDEAALFDVIEVRRKDDENLRS